MNLSIGALMKKTAAIAVAIAAAALGLAFTNPAFREKVAGALKAPA